MIDNLISGPCEPSIIGTILIIQCSRVMQESMLEMKNRDSQLPADPDDIIKQEY